MFNPQPKPQKSIKNKRRVSRVSSKPKYRCSDGTLVSQSYINKMYSQESQKFLLGCEMYCHGTGSNEYPLSVSHTISRDRCKKIGKADLIWHHGNMELEGHHERSSNPKAAHNIWEDGSWDDKKKLLNFDRKIDFIRENDPDYYKIIENQLL